MSGRSTSGADSWRVNNRDRLRPADSERPGEGERTPAVCRDATGSSPAGKESPRKTTVAEVYRGAGAARGFPGCSNLRGAGAAKKGLRHLREGEAGFVMKRPVLERLPLPISYRRRSWRRSLRNLDDASRCPVNSLTDEGPTFQFRFRESDCSAVPWRLGFNNLLWVTDTKRVAIGILPCIE